MTTSRALNLTRAGKTIGDFVLDDLSSWYVRLGRKRFWHGEMTEDKHTAYATLHEVLLTTVKLLAPFVPFTSEDVFRGLVAHADATAWEGAPAGLPGRRHRPPGPGPRAPHGRGAGGGEPRPGLAAGGEPQGPAAALAPAARTASTSVPTSCSTTGRSSATSPVN